MSYRRQSRYRGSSKTAAVNQIDRFLKERARGVPEAHSKVTCGTAEPSSSSTGAMQSPHYLGSQPLMGVPALLSSPLSNQSGAGTST